MMDARSTDKESNIRRNARRDAGRMLGVAGCVLAAVGAATAFSIGGVSIASGVLGVSLGVAGYLLGSRGWGGAAIMLCIAALFVGLSASQNLF
jgi:hypothetical protein